MHLYDKLCRSRAIKNIYLDIRVHTKIAASHWTSHEAEAVVSLDTANCSTFKLK
jgi:hypothetical protein